MTLRRAVMAVLLGAGAAACDGGDKSVSYSASMPAPATRGADDLVIKTTDGSMELAVRTDSIRVRLSDSVRNKASDKLDTSKVQGNGIGASIEKFVKSNVEKGLGTEVSVPIADFSDAKVENGAIVLVPRKPTSSPPFSSTKVNNKPLMESFSVADAENFTALVRARIAKGF